MSNQFKPQLVVVPLQLLEQLDLHVLLMLTLQARNDGVLRQTDLIEHDKRSTGIDPCHFGFEYVQVCSI